MGMIGPGHPKVQGILSCETVSIAENCKDDVVLMPISYKIRMHYVYSAISHFQKLIDYILKNKKQKGGGQAQRENSNEKFDSSTEQLLEKSRKSDWKKSNNASQTYDFCQVECVTAADNRKKELQSLSNDNKM